MGKKNRKEISIIRSSAAEYLTFITATGESEFEKYRIVDCVDTVCII